MKNSNIDLNTYEVKSMLDEFEFEKKITLTNINTGTVNVCRDDSYFFNEDENNKYSSFHFLTKNAQYKCKISLPIIYLDGDNLDEYLVQNKEKISNRNYFTIVNKKGDKYYINEGTATKFGLRVGERIELGYTIKDLIQVDETIHPYFYWNII